MQVKTKPHRGVCAECGQERAIDAEKQRCTPCRRSALSPAVELRLTTITAKPTRKRTAAEIAADAAAAERMRNHKPNPWRLGKSPSSYG